MRRAALSSSLIVFVWLGACSSSSTPAGQPPAAEPDASVVEPPEGDASVDPKDDASTPDTGATDSGSPDTLLGTLTGSCGVVRTQLLQAAPSFEVQYLSFVAGEKFEKASLSADAQRILSTPNAGGSSIESEVMSFEILRHCEGAKLLKTEKEILYTSGGDGGNNITDNLLEIDGKKVGVNPLRIYRPSNITLSDADVKKDLSDKLISIKRSSERVVPADKWVKQVMHVWTATAAATDAVKRMYPTIDADTKADTIVLVTEAKGGGFLFCNPDPPLGSECPPAN
jgi:hypothetical protein